ncbi:MAG: cysteine--tRNA ligase [Planctomycetes bacterium]|jgi:cysteinyl-tRNA synthetase|nr:cysteine--tRNA ligase [Planctomycetota bacterium]
MGIRLYNSLSNSKEDFTPLVPGRVTMYNCGPTVYDYAHIGNFRSFLLADLLRRTFEARGFSVRQVMNITDVGHMTVDDLRDTGEDKMAVAARRLGMDPLEVARFYEQAFFTDIETLNFRKASAYPRATESIPGMIALIEQLVAKGHAYAIGGNVYFDLSTFPAYGRLSGNTVEQLKAGARLDPNPEKRNPADFALWKTDPGHLMQWDSPFGRGFPGWHIECSVMAMAHLGESIDVHTGGEDNRFPHHECEIAQSEAATGRPFARFWLHARHFLVNGEKMSKSAGNFWTLRDVLSMGHEPMAVRLALLSVQYRSPMNLTLDLFTEAAKNLARIRDLLGKIGPDAAAPDRPEVVAAAARARADFDAAIDDDLNVSPARAALLGLVTEVNRAGVPLSAGDGAAVRGAIAAMDGVLGLKLAEAPREETLEEEVARLIEARAEARRQRDFAKADRIRRDLAGRGILLEDTSRGTVWKRG